MTSLQLGGSGQTPMREDFTYTARDQVATQIRYADLAGQNKIGSSTFTYDSVGHLTNLQHVDGSGNNIANYVNAFDLASRITSETLNGGTPTTYTYDNTNQLTNDSVNAYSYDLNGNRTMSGYTTGPANEITSDGTWNYFHDQNGNLVGKTNPTTGETWTYAYDNRNRLTSATQTTSEGLQMQATYVYNALGQRIEKDVTQSGVTTITRFAYDRSEIWADLTATNALQTRYIRGERVLELLAWIASGTVAWILVDRMGSVRNVLDDTGAIIDAIEYDGFGNIVSEMNPSSGGSYKFAGYRLESETGLNRPDTTTGRYYNSLVGVWMERDPIRFHAEEANLYRYVGNNPVIATDPSGLKWTVERKGAPKANATSAANDTIQDLADLIGLDGGEFKKWLTIPGGRNGMLTLATNQTVDFNNLELKAPLAACQVVQIPNIVSALWVGDLTGKGGRGLSDGTTTYDG
jgi:RHS repeat-associated protein